MSKILDPIKIFIKVVDLTNSMVIEARSDAVKSNIA